VIVKELLYRYVLRTATESHSIAMTVDAGHHRSDALTSLAAFVGISVALVGGEGFESADDWAALTASVIIAFNGYRLLVPAVQEIMDAAPPPLIAERVRAAAAAVEGVAGLEKCSVRKMGLVYYVDLHVEVDGRISVDEGHRISHDVKDAVRAAEPRVADALIHIEPSPK
jgi:cation diffusion facilitator family transporter